MIKSILISLSILISPLLFAQQNVFFQEKSESDIKLIGQRHTVPNEYKIFEINFTSLKQYLDNAPLGYTNPNKLRVVIPTPTGKRTYAIANTPVLSAEIQNTRPDIKTFTGYNEQNKGEWIKLDYTSNGFHAMIMTSEGGGIFIDPFQTNDTRNYILYYKKDLTNKEPMICELESNNLSFDETKIANRIAEGDCQLRTYRLAIAATTEYTAFHGGVSSAQAAIVTSINRVNGMFERDVALTLNIISGTNIIYGGADPYANNNGGTMLGQNQTNLDAVIGSANYDIGHVFSTGGGGVASLNSPCNNSQKARGVTGLAAPIGDAFDIDYVAHEMGHQFGGEHTFNATTGSCGGGNRNGSTAFEPGSGTSIMAYAGICSPSDVQNNSDALYHAATITQMSDFITGSGNSCASLSSSGNTAPVSNADVNYTIPKRTPFELIGIGTDADASDVLSYSWEQYELGPAQNKPNTSNTTEPNFRVFLPNNSPTRIFPQISDIVAGTQWPTWEVIPHVDRQMRFRLTVRDNSTGGYGCTHADNTRITTYAGGGTFTVINPNTAVTWQAFTTKTVSWNEAGTSSAPVSTSNVDIFLSTDGGYTYPITIATGVPNTGSATITVPNNPTTTARIKVKGADNVFFDISNVDFEITPPTIPDFTLSATANSSTTVCKPGTATYDVAIGSILSFSDPVTLSASGNPSNTTVSFSPNPVNPGSTSVMTLTVAAGATNGNTDFDVIGNSTGGLNHSDQVSISITASPASVSLTSPSNGATGVSTIPDYDWSSSGRATSYEIDVATDAAFTNIVENATTTPSDISSGINLTAFTQYFWRIRAINNCGNSNYSSTFSFTTGNVTYCTPTYTTGTSNGDFIDAVTLGAINNIGTGGTSGPDYNDYTSMSTDLELSTTYSINITSGDQANDNFAAFIDFDRDGEFTGAEYLGLVTTNAPYQTKQITFTVPSGAVQGPVRLRVRCVRNVNPIDPCSQENQGETEDYTVNILPACTNPPATPTVTASGATTICPEENLVLTSSASNNQWQLNGSDISTETAQNLTVTASGNYTVYSTNACGTTSSSTTSVTVFAATSVSFSGLSSTYCEGENISTLTGSPSGGTFTGNGISGNTFDPVSAGIASHDITYTYIDGNSCSNTVTSTATVNANPNVSISNFATTYCSTDGNPTFTVSPAGGNSFINGALLSNPLVVLSSLGVGSHTLLYEYTDGNNCSNSDSVIFSITPGDPPSMNFSYTANSLDVTFTNLSSNSDSYHWDFGDGTDFSDDSPIYSYASPGTYTVCLTGENNNCGGITSDTCIDITLAIKGIEYSLFNNYNIFPNPTNGELNIELDLISPSAVSFELVNLLGEQVTSTLIASKQGKFKTQMNLEGFGSGIYFLKIHASDESKVIKIILD